MRSEENQTHEDSLLVALFGKITLRVAVRGKTPASPIVVHLTGNAEIDATLLSNAYALRDAEELRVGHSVLLMV